jgi:hypothetical protein
MYPTEHWMSYLSMGLASESGEVCGKAKKIIRGDSKLDLAQAVEVYKEISDVCWYASNLCDELGKCFPEHDFSYQSVHRANLDKLFSRYTRGAVQGIGDNR